MTSAGTLHKANMFEIIDVHVSEGVWKQGQLALLQTDSLCLHAGSRQLY